MDRREALKKLGIAGAVAAGGSVVLSSGPVAAATSGVCLPQIPDSINVEVIAPSSPQSRLYVNGPNGDPRVNSTTYQWANLTMLAGGGTADLRNATNQQVELQRKNPNTTNWLTSDQFRIDLTITWNCISPNRSDVATYRVTANYPGAGNTATVSVARYS